MKIEQPEIETSLLKNATSDSSFVINPVNDLHLIISNLRLLHSPPQIDLDQELYQIIQKINPQYQPPSPEILKIATLTLIDQLRDYLQDKPTQPLVEQLNKQLKIPTTSAKVEDLDSPVSAYLYDIKTFLKTKPFDTTQLPQFWTEKNYEKNLRPWIYTNNRLRPKMSGSTSIA